MKKILIAAGLMGLLCPSFVLAVPPNNMKTDYPEIYFEQKAGAFLLKAYADLKAAAAVVVADRKGLSKFNGGEDAFVTGSDSTKHPFGAFGTWGAMVGEDRTKSGGKSPIAFSLDVYPDGSPASFIESAGGLDLILNIPRWLPGYNDNFEHGDYIFGRIVSENGYISFSKSGRTADGYLGPMMGPENAVMLLKAGIKKFGDSDSVDRVQAAYLLCKDRGNILDFLAYVLIDGGIVYALPPSKASLHWGAPTVLSKLKPSAFAGCSKGGI